MKNSIFLTLFPFYIAGLVIFSGNITSLSAQPVLSNIETKNLEYTPGDGQVIVTTKLEVDAINLFSATIRISGGYEASEDKLIYSGTRFNWNWNSNTGTLILTGYGSESRYQTALRSIRYENSNVNDPSTQTRVVSFTVNNGFTNSNTLSRNITIVQTDLPPVLKNVETDPVIFCLNSGTVLITSSLTVEDSDEDNLVSASVRITTGYTVDEDRLLFNAQNGISGSWNNTSGTLSLSGTATLAQYQAALRSIRYENNNPENPHAGSHEISFSVSDGVLQSNTVTRSLVHVVPSATISGNFDICRDEEVALQVTLTGNSPWNFSYRINSGAPVAVQNVNSGTYLIPANKEGTYTLIEVNDKYCPGKVSGSAVIDVQPEPVVSISGLAPAYSRESTEWIPLTGTPGGGTFFGPGVIPYNEDWFFIPALPPVGVHQIIYRYRPDEASCYGYDTISVRILEKSAAIQIENDRTHFCNNDAPFQVTGINLISNEPGDFSITGGRGITDHGNNIATVYPDSLEINQYTITYTASDGTDALMDIEVGSPLKADFSWSLECFDNEQPIVFTSIPSSPFGFLTDDSYRWTIHTDSDSVTYSSKNVTHIFPEPGNYLVKLRLQNSNGCVNETEKMFPLMPVFTLAETNYFEDFDEEQHWQSGNDPATPINSWQLGTPSELLNGFSNPYSGANCWFTNLTMNPIPREDSWITSPCFDFTGTEKPTLVARIRRSFTDNRDGANVKYTTDNGLHWNPVGNLNDGINWFNAYYGNPGAQSQGWTAIIDNDWVETRHVLDFLKGEPVVQFRFVFNAYGSALGNKGIAVDDIRIVERNRTILIEHFTNTSTLSTAADDLLDEIALLSGPNLIDLQYHTADPEDPFYSDNPVIPNTRQLYYGLSGVPYAIINGGTLNSQHIDYTVRTLNPSQIGIESLYDSDFEIKVTTMQDGNTLYAESVITSLQDVPLSELSVRMVVIEPLIVDSAGASEDSVFRNVVRAMLPDAAGNTIYRSWQKGDNHRIVESWEIENVFNSDGLRVVAFIQNEMTREIHQASLDVRGVFNDIANPHDAGTPLFSIFPNPAGEFLSISFFEENSETYNIELFNNVGATVYRQEATGESVHTIPVQYLAEGLYLLRITVTNGAPETRKIIIKHAH